MTSAFHKTDPLRDSFWRQADYRDFLNDAIEDKLQSVIKTKSKLAELLDLSPAMITKIFAKNGHLTFEHVEILARQFDFSEIETLAFLDKMACVRATSPELKAITEKRLRIAFDKAYEPVVMRSETQAAPPGNLLFFKIVEVISRGAYTVSEIASVTGIQAERVKFLLERLQSYYKITETQKNHTKAYSIHEDQLAYGPRKPGSQELFELAMSVRRLASYSLETRYPISIVGETEHYVSGSYMIPMSPEQLAELKIEFALLTKRITETASRNKIDERSKFVGVSFDMFDINI